MSSLRVSDIRLKVFRAYQCLFIFGIITLCTSTHAHAQIAVDKLTQKNVAAFIEKTSAITSGQNLEMSNEEITQFLNIHLDDRARFKSILKYNIPGYPSQETSLTLEKSDFIDSIKSGASALENYENKIKIKAVKISKDKTKATVQTTGYETGHMPVKGENDTTQYLPVEGESQCDQIIMLNRDIIQMYSANCTTVITFQSY